MGALEGHGKRCLLGADHLIGREPAAALRFDDESVSWRHASLRWTGQAWELQDLGSTNGTFLNGERVAPGSRTLLRLGAELRFGNSTEVWVLADVDPPGTAVVDLATGEYIFAADDLIALPKPETPELFISQQADGEWIVEQGETVRVLAPLEVLNAGGRQYRFEPGALVHATRAGTIEQLTPSALALEFVVSRDEEYVEVTIAHRERKIPLRPRAHTYLLLTLARLRVQDQADASISQASHGWVYQEELLKMLATSPTQLAVDIYRARKQFSEVGVVDAAQVVERRPTTHELRIGVPKLAVRVG
ncbi:MAG TPA: FHA domain-containing protein [Polyangiaceae bacterium]